AAGADLLWLPGLAQQSRPGAIEVRRTRHTHRDSYLDQSESLARSFLRKSGGGGHSGHERWKVPRGTLRVGARLPQEICGFHLRLGGKASADWLAIGGLGRSSALTHPALSGQTPERSRRQHNLQWPALRYVGEKNGPVGCDEIRRDVLRTVFSRQSSPNTNKKAKSFTTKDTQAARRISIHAFVLPSCLCGYFCFWIVESRPSSAKETCSDVIERSRGQASRRE